MLGSDVDRVRSRRPGVENRGWSSTCLHYVVERSGGRVTLCAVCTVHEETMSAYLFIEPQNQGQRFIIKTTGAVCQWFDLETTRTVPLIWPKNRQLRFGDLDLKITVTVSWFSP
jgi:hypothetical protein